MKADDEVWLDLLIDETGAGSDFGGAVEEFRVGEVLGTEWRDGFLFGAGEGDARAEFFEEWFEIFCGAESHRTFFDGRGVAVFQIAFFDLGELAADMPGVDGDEESFEG